VETLHLAGQLAELPAARHWVAEALAARQVGAELSQIIVMLADELLANAITHGSPPFSLSLEFADGHVRCEVADGSNYLPALGHSNPTETSGRGLELVAKLATRWGTEIEGLGKKVWFELDANAA